VSINPYYFNRPHDAHRLAPDERRSQAVAGGALRVENMSDGVSVCLCMIARDEAKNIQRALTSALALADRYVVLDTGSKDATVKLTRSFLRDRNKDHLVVETNWKGYAGSRNEALALAKQGSDYVVFLDADDVFFGDAQLTRAMLSGHNYWVCHSYQGWIRNTVQFAVRSSENFEWVGARHEFIQARKGSVGSTPTLMPTISVRYGHTGFRSRQADTWRLDHQALCAELRELGEANAWQVARNQFYQALTLQASGSLLAAQSAFEERAAMPGGDEEERWFADLCGTRLAEMLQTAPRNYARRYSKLILERPNRAEVYLDLARRLRLDGKYREAIQMALACEEIAQCDDWINVDTAAHSIHAWDEQATNFFELGEFKRACILWKRVLLFGGQTRETRQRVKQAITSCTKKMLPAD
jgi:glycosyltransferase involved in cell wall biosynthesis